jgi:hypothetical protein
MHGFVIFLMGYVVGAFVSTGVILWGWLLHNRSRQDYGEDGLS